MKRMIVFLFTAVVLIATKFIDNQPNFNEFEEVESVVVVCSVENEYMDYIFQSGEDYYYHFEGEKAFFILQNLDVFVGMEGLNLYFSNTVDFSYFSSRLDFLGEETLVEGNKVYYGYYKGYKKSEIIDGKKINVQLVQTEDGWIMGLPMILTGF